MQKNIIIGVALCALLVVTNATLTMEKLELNIAFHNPETNSPHHTPRSHEELSKLLAALADDQGYVYERPADSYFTAPNNTNSNNDNTLVKYPTHTGVYTNELSPSLSHLPIHTLVHSSPMPNKTDGISYRDKTTGKLKAIPFNSHMEYKQERYIVITNNENNKNEPTFIIENDPDNPIKLEETPQDALIKQQSIEKLRKLKSTLSNPKISHSKQQQTSKEANASDDAENKNTSIEQQEIEKTESLSPKLPHQHASSSFKRTIMGTSFIVFCIALAYKYNKLPDSFAQLLNTIFAQFNNLIPSNLTR